MGGSPSSFWLFIGIVSVNTIYISGTYAFIIAFRFRCLMSRCVDPIVARRGQAEGAADTASVSGGRRLRW